MAPLWGRGESGLHQAHRPPPSPHDPQPLTSSLRTRQDPPPSRTTGPQHMPTLDSQPEGHAHHHQHTHMEPSAASTPFPTPCHTHQRHMPGGGTPSCPLQRTPSSPERHYQHHRPRWGLHHSSIHHSLTDAGPSAQRGTRQPLPATSRVTSIPPLPSVPHTDCTGNREPRYENSLPRLQKATPLSRPGDTALHTHRLETRTCPPGDRPSPTANHTAGPKPHQTHADHRHPPQGKMAHTKTPNGRPGPTDGPQQLPTYAKHMLGL